MSTPKSRRVRTLHDRQLEADRRFFERWPHRLYRVRRVFHDEAETMLLHMGFCAPAEGEAFFTAMRQMAPELRLREFFVAKRDLDTDMSDAEAASIFDELAEPWLVPGAARQIAARRAA